MGPICESGDFLAQSRDMEAVESGDLLALMSAGAYGFSMSSNYNSRPRAAEVLVDGDKYFVIRDRESYEDLDSWGEDSPGILQIELKEQRMFSGTFTAIVTPFKDGRVDEAAFKKLIRFGIDGGVSGFVPCGTTGESPALSHEEHNRVIELTVKEVAGQVKVIAGTGSNSTEEAIALTQTCQGGGRGRGLDGFAILQQADSRRAVSTFQGGCRGC